MVIAIGNDHSGVELKNIISEHLKKRGIDVMNMGTDSSEDIDYPIFAKKVASEIISGNADLGILICGTGVGMSITANKIKGIRAVVCSEPCSARLAREHNDTNILTFGARIIAKELAKMIVDEWLDASFKGGRHQIRVDMYE